jgi:PIN domain nuclease of toxin-antitoxin system
MRPGMVDEPKRYVFDSFALLAYFGNEPGTEMVEQLLRQAQDRTATLHLSTDDRIVHPLAP